MNIIHVIISAIFVALMMSLFLIYIAIPVLIAGGIYILYQYWKAKLFPSDDERRSVFRNFTNFSEIDEKEEASQKVIDVDFHRVRIK